MDKEVLVNAIKCTAQKLEHQGIKLSLVILIEEDIIAMNPQYKLIMSSPDFDNKSPKETYRNIINILKEKIYSIATRFGRLQPYPMISAYSLRNMSSYNFLTDEISCPLGNSDVISRIKLIKSTDHFVQAMNMMCLVTTNDEPRDMFHQYIGLEFVRHAIVVISQPVN